MTREPVVVAENLGKKYWLYPTVTRRVLGCFLGPERVGASPTTVLTGLSFVLYPGEAIALIGKNGAGKSTALQILAGIIPPSEGKYITRGRVCALLELGAGFNPEFTGRQNIHIAGLLSGLSHKEICASEASIIDFAEIGEYIDQPVKFYSSGMFLRLAFAVALAGKPDILIVDEALAVGDIFFRQKCYTRLRELRKQGMAVLLVTHNMADVTEFCDRAILLERSKQFYYGTPKEALHHYYMSIDKTDKQNGSQMPLVYNNNRKKTMLEDIQWEELYEKMDDYETQDGERLTTNVDFVKYLITDSSGEPTTTFIQGTIIKIYSIFLIHSEIAFPVTGTTIWNSQSTPIYSAGSALYDEQIYSAPANSLFCAEQSIKLDIACGEYIISHGLGSFIPSDMRRYWNIEDWEKHNQRLVVAKNLARITVILPEESIPSRVKGFGLVNLETKTSTYVYHNWKI